MISSNRIKALVSLHLDFSGKETAIAIIDLVRYRSEGELPYRPYSDALHQHENRYKIETASNLTRHGSGRTKSAGAESWVASRRCVLPLCG